MAVKAKDIDVVADPRCVDIDETKTPASLVFIGHVDAGKSTISGQIVLQMGLVDDRTIQQFKEEAIKKGRDSWWLAYVMDNSEEEKAKGKTVDIGRTCFDTPKKSWTIFDAPGHKNYVPNMIQGVCQADYAGLVISARQGEFESGFEKDGQTREHIQLVRSLGVKKLVIVVNKMDEQSVKWKKSRFDEIKKNLTPFLYATGYTDDDLYWIPISGLGGDNITEKSDKCSWYEGPPLMEILDDMPMEYRDPAAPLRVPVMDKMKDQKMIVFGKVEQGTLRLGDKLAIAPSNRPCQVLQIENFKDELVKLARPGDNVKISVSNLAEEDVRKGDCLCPREIPMHSSQVLMCEIRLLELRVPILTAGSSFTIHLHTYSDLVDIQTIEWTIEKDPASGADLKKEAPKFAKSGSLCMVRIKTRMPVPVEKEEVLGALGRFTLRDEGKTVALGKICKFVPVRKEGIVRPPVPSASAAAKEEKKTDDAVTVDKS
jgi:peptide chain release factor subunit 3